MPPLKIHNCNVSCYRECERLHTDPHVPSRQIGWVEVPYAYARVTRQVALRKLKPNGKWLHQVLVFNLTDELVFALAGQSMPQPVPNMSRYSRRSLLTISVAAEPKLKTKAISKASISRIATSTALSRKKSSLLAYLRTTCSFDSK